MPELNDTPSAQLYENVRFACWREQPNDRDRWPVLLMRWLQGPGDAAETSAAPTLEDAEAVLAGQRSLSREETLLIAQALDRATDDLMFENWPHATPGLVLRENVKRLLGDNGPGNKGKTAKSLGVSQQTMSRWLHRGQAPDTKAKRAIVAMFGLRSVEELEQSPLFLSYLPVTHVERLAWLSEQLRSMPPAKLRSLFPSLQRILSGPPRGP